MSINNKLIDFFEVSPIIIIIIIIIITIIITIIIMYSSHFFQKQPDFILSLGGGKLQPQCSTGIIGAAWSVVPSMLIAATTFGDMSNNFDSLKMYLHRTELKTGAWLLQ